MPPSIHPDTVAPYLWLGANLLELDFAALPVIGKGALDLIGRAIGSEHAAVLVSGTGTHDAGVAFVAELVASGARDEEVDTIVRGLLPPDYGGNSLEELPGWIESAREKRFDQRHGVRGYESGEEGPIPVETVDEFDAVGLHDLIGKFPFKDPKNADLLFGWIAIAPICGVLDWRPHAFLFGPPNSGKTTLHNLVAAALKPMVISADGQSTEAGVRQRLGPDALPVVIDEFETDGRHGRLQAIMRLARNASSADSPLLRGTPEGKALQFSIKTMMLLSAVNVTGMSPTDQSRFVLAELKAHDSDPAVASAIARESARFSTRGPTWCGYMIGLASAVLEGTDTLKAEMPTIDSRLRQMMASLLAGRFAALHRRPPKPVEAQAIVEEYRSTITAHQQDQDRDNGRECLEHLMSHFVRDSRGEERSLGFWLAEERVRPGEDSRPNAEPESARILRNHQIKFYVSDEVEGVLIRSGAPPINEVYRGTKWADGAWQRALGQLPGAFKLEAPQRFSGLPSKHRSVGLPLA